MEGRCGGVEVRNKVEKKKKKKKMKRGFLLVLKHSVTHFHFHCSSIKSFPSRIPQFPQNTSLSLWMNTQTHTSLTHIYHTNQQPSMSSPEFKSLPNSSFSFSKQHTQSPSLSPPKTIISLVNPQNQSLPPFSLIHLIGFKNVIE